MVAPIIQIPIDDEDFKNFLDAFKKYQDQVQEQPEIWNDVNESIKDLLSTSVDLAVSIDKQMEATKRLAEEEDKRDRKLQTAAQKRKQEDNDLRRRDEETARRRKESIKNVKDYAASAGGFAGSLGNWAAGGGHIGELAQSAGGGLGVASEVAGEALAGVAGGIVSGIGTAVAGALAGAGLVATAAYGVNKYAAGIYRRAGGMGVSPGELEYAENNQQRYYDVDQAIQSMAIMQRTPQAWSTFGLLGLNPRNANTAKLTNEAVLRARRLFIQQGQNLDLASRQGLTSFLSPDALIRLAGTSEAKLKASMAKGEDLSKMGITRSTGDAAADFVAAMDNSTSKLKDTFINGLGQLDPKLSECVTWFGKLADDLKEIVPMLDKVAHLFRFGDSSSANAINTSNPKLSNDLYSNIVTIGEHGQQGQVSSKGAMGISQLMPETAKFAASQAFVTYDPQLLNAKTPQGEVYNKLLGRTFVTYLNNLYDADPALIYAAYNAGPAAVNYWNKHFGDPRTGKISDLEWAKKIPWQGDKSQWETHNYVMRLLGHPELQNKPILHSSKPKKKASIYVKTTVVNKLPHQHSPSGNLPIALKRNASQ